MGPWVKFQTFTRALLILLVVVTLGYDLAVQASPDASDTAPAIDDSLTAPAKLTPAVSVVGSTPGVATAVDSLTPVPLMTILPENTNGLVEASLLSQLRQGYQQLCSDCRIEFKDIKIPAFSPEDVADLKIDFQSLKWGGSFLFPVEFLGQPQAYISGQVRLHRKGVQAARAVNALEILSAADVKEDWIDATFLKDQPAGMEDLSGAVAKRFLSLRQPILKSDLRLPQIVSRGQIIKVLTGTENFEIVSQMRAEDSGSMGEMIRVKTDANKILSVKVSAPGTARLE